VRGVADRTHFPGTRNFVQRATMGCAIFIQKLISRPIDRQAQAEFPRVDMLLARCIRAGFLPVIVLVLLAIHGPARALDLAQVQRDGAIVVEALALGGKGDWQGAEAVAARTGNLVVRDIVLWRKLRDGKGTVREYQSFVTRRGTWPGQKMLARIVLANRQGPEILKPELSGPARRNWAAFSRLWRGRKYDAAEEKLAELTLRLEALGLPSVWADRRRRLARRAARYGRIERAYLLASQHYLTPDDGYAYADCEWIAGWIALTRMNDPQRALMHFNRFAAVVETPISLGRAGYWQGRAYQALGDTSAATVAYARAAVYQTSFYGQLAAAEIDTPGNLLIAMQELPDWQKSPALRIDDVEAAVILHFADENQLAFQFFTHLGQNLDGIAAVAALADLALDLGQTHYAVRIAKYAARRGTILMPAYYPITELSGYASKIEPALALAIARQETELNPRAISPVGARGLMQLMPRTAKKVAAWLGEPYSKARLTEDWQYNARLGQSYLAEQVSTFGGSYVMAAAAYNAGPDRVDRWIGEFGDPRLPGADIIDWIETIPFRETRNYVQRVIEALYVYRARLSGAAGPMTIVNDLNRGRR